VEVEEDVVVALNGVKEAADEEAVVNEKVVEGVAELEVAVDSEESEVVIEEVER